MVMVMMMTTTTTITMAITITMMRRTNVTSVKMVDDDGNDEDGEFS